MGRWLDFTRKRRRAWRLRIPLTTSRRFQLPHNVRVAGKMLPLKLPHDPGVRVAFGEVLLGDCYRLEQMPRPINTVLDIGANVGVFCLAARQAFPQAILHAYEPNPALLEYLKNQAELTRADFFMSAVARVNGMVRLDLKAESVWTTSTLDPSGDVPAVGFSEAIDRLGGYVDLVKMDCEGAEWDILEDDQPWLRVRNVTMEYHLTPAHHPSTYHTQIRDIITRKGFTITHQSAEVDVGFLCASRIRAQLLG